MKLPVVSHRQGRAERHTQGMGWARATGGIEIGLRRPLAVREETISRGSDRCRVAFVSDIHLRRGRSERLSGQVLDALDRANPDLVLLGGDFLDQATELPALGRLLAGVRGIAPAFAVSGNHDAAVGLPKVRETVERAGVVWLDGGTATHKHDGRLLGISGTGAPPCPAADFRILCTHHPWEWRRVRTLGFDLVLAGHLHGCQVAWFEAGGRLFPGACFYPHNHLRQRHGNTRLVVGTGCADLIPVRWNCPREIVVCLV